MSRLVRNRKKARRSQRDGISLVVQRRTCLGCMAVLIVDVPYFLKSGVWIKCKAVTSMLGIENRQVSYSIVGHPWHMFLLLLHTNASDGSLCLS